LEIIMKHLLATIALSIAAFVAYSQTIERVKMSDNDLSCQQVFSEIGQMDTIITRPSASAAGAAQGEAGGASTQIAGNVAQAALAVATSPGPLGNFGGLGGGLGSMFGGLAQMAQGAASQRAAQQAAQQAAAQQQAAAAQQGQTLQAQGRKEHLTSLFLSKGCKMSDVQK
jgi:hypothetical protein